MNKYYRFFILFLSLSFGVGAVNASDSPWKFRLPFKSAIIYYDIEGTLKGKETLYIRRYGQETVRVTKTKGKLLFVPMNEDKVEITTLDWLTTIDNKKKTGTKIINPIKIFTEEYNKLSSKEKANVHKNIKELGVNMTRQLGGSVKPRAGKHLGYTCDIVTAMGITACQMSQTSVVLKTQGKLLGIKIDSVATKIDKNVRIPDELFTQAAGINIVRDKKTDDLNRQAAKKMINYLKDPNASKKLNDMATKSSSSTAGTDQATPRNDDGQTPPAEDAGVKGMMKKGIGNLKGLFRRVQ